jgi:2-hydroxycyclohexanecarboxyl-CoA dehydrogenase
MSSASDAGRVAVVTGGAQGIGAAIARRFAGQGDRVAIFDLDGATAEKTAGAVSDEFDVEVIGIGVDISSRSDVLAGVSETVNRLGPIEILVNNAGIDVIQPFLESNEDAWDRILAVNLKGLFNCCHVMVPGMVERGEGRVVNIGSDAGRVGSSGEAVYSATKGGVIAFTKTLAREVARSGVTVNCVCPGPTETALLGQVAEASQKLYDSLARAIPLHRLGQPDDVAPVVVFLTNEESAFITGQTLSVSGGLTMS